MAAAAKIIPPSGTHFSIAKNDDYVLLLLRPFSFDKEEGAISSQYKKEEERRRHHNHCHQRRKGRKGKEGAKCVSVYGVHDNDIFRSHFDVSS